MKRIETKDLKNCLLKKVSSTPNFSNVYLLKNGQYLKIFDDPILYASSLLGVSLEDKIKNAKPVLNVPEILIPNTIVYHNNQFVGYIIEAAKGIPYEIYYENLPTTDLYKYALLYEKIESAVKRANEQEIIFPDLLTISNIFVKKGKGKIEFIDYDGLQIGNKQAYQFSSALGEESTFRNKKYMTKPLVFTKNIDKKSLIHLYFLSTFNADLSKIGQKDPYTGNVLTLDDVLKALGIDDNDLAHKLWLATIDNSQDNEYLDQTVFTIADKYDLKIIGQHKDLCIKKLVRKK